MDWQTIVFEVIDMRSFSNLWFWIILAVMWSTSSHWILGVPFDMVGRAQKVGGQAAVDLEDLARIHVNRVLYIAETAGLILLGLGCFVLTALFLLGAFYGIEFAQALFLLGFPTSVVWLLNIRLAKRIRDGQLQADALCTMLSRHRVWIQVIGMMSIFVTALWGMYQNLSYGALIH
ncbi:component of SufBCD complex [Pseudoprimorskyibacter insulae]|uniref:Component of SufBCD complex n=1 Tax=Pseudoprimorskyibacter insulae TaxID=1695997 RepID=A0A2R8AWQ6_9RHOB|nr:component of SufBCD complex [Pseudoprimorskyibacter insulae]SPF80357.1 hypothetical protein PRI8871_02162 [Pseudoprimorskyibacter insulae]